WVGPALVFDHHPSEIPALAPAEFARDDQVGLLKDGSAGVRLGGLAVVIHVRDRESDASRAELAIDERECRGVVAPGAVDASHGGASNRELVDARRSIGFRFPASSIVVGILSKSGGTERENNADEQCQFHSGRLYPVEIVRNEVRFIRTRCSPLPAEN